MRTTTAIAAVLVGSLFCHLATADETPAPKKYSLKALDSTFATPYSPKMATNSLIPFDKTYAELSNEEKRLVRSQYEGMGELDEPPFPKNGLAPLYRAVADGQQRRLAEGDLSIIVDIDSTGQATKAAVYKTPDAALANYVAGVLLKHPYKPGVCDGKPCSMAYPFRVKLRTE